eukprot:2363717-Rhodomonas_salina.1
MRFLWLWICLCKLYQGGAKGETILSAQILRPAHDSVFYIADQRVPLERISATYALSAEGDGDVPPQCGQGR